MNAKKLNIMLADDDKDDRDFFKAAVSDLFPLATLYVAKDGEELMKCLSDERELIPDVLFLDINMPRKNGLECLAEIKQNEKLKNIPVVMFSTSNSWDTINVLFKSGANVYIHKPSDFAQLKQVIHHAVPIAAERTSLKTPLKYILNAANSERPTIA